MYKGNVQLQYNAPHNQSLHQEIHFILFGADFWKSLWSRKNQRRRACHCQGERPNQLTIEKQANPCGARSAFSLLPCVVFKPSALRAVTEFLLFHSHQPFCAVMIIISVWFHISMIFHTHTHTHTQHTTVMTLSYYILSKANDPSVIKSITKPRLFKSFMRVTFRSKKEELPCGLLMNGLYVINITPGEVLSSNI